MYPVSAEFLETIKESHVSIAKAEVLDKNGNIVLADLPVTQGYVAIDAEADNRRTARVVIGPVSEDVLDVVGPASPTFSRASIAYREGIEFASNTARVLNGGVLIEEGTTNLTTDAGSRLDAIAAVSTGGTFPPAITADTTIKREGTASIRAEFPADASTSTDGFINTQAVSVAVGQTVTFSVWLYKFASPLIAYITGYQGAAALQLVEGSATGWGRYAASYTNNTASAGSQYIRIYKNGAGSIAVVHLDQYQVEEKTYSTTWHPGGITRNHEIMDLPPTILEPDEGSIEIDVLMTFSQTKPSTRIFEAKRTTGSNGLLIYRSGSTGSNWALHVTNDAGTSDSRQVIAVADGWHRFSVVWDANEIIFLVDGVQVGTPIAKSLMPSAFETFALGRYIPTTDYFINMPIGAMRVSNVRRTSEELADWQSRLTKDLDTTYMLPFDKDIEPVREFVLAGQNYPLVPDGMAHALAPGINEFRLYRGVRLLAGDQEGSPVVWNADFTQGQHDWTQESLGNLRLVF